MQIFGQQKSPIKSAYPTFSSADPLVLIIHEAQSIRYVYFYHLPQCSRLQKKLFHVAKKFISQSISLLIEPNT